jgi:hypothetical protein
MPTNCPIVVIEDFNIDMLTKTSQSTTLQNVMNKYNLKHLFSKHTTINDTTESYMD